MITRPIALPIVRHLARPIVRSHAPPTIISGFAYPGETLTSTGTGQWYVDDVPIIGETGDTYVVRLDDIGKPVRQGSSNVLVVWSPLDLSPALWLSDTGSNTAQWDDLSGNGRHATQAIGANQPAIIAGERNGRQVRRFDGINDGLSSGTNSTWNFLHNGTNCAVFIVAKIGAVANPDAVYPILRNGDGSSNNVGYTFSWDDRSSVPRNDALVSSQSRGVNNSFATNSMSLDAYPANTWGIIENRLHATATLAEDRNFFAINGGAPLKSNTLNNAFSSANSINPLLIGWSASFFSLMDCAEILIFPTALTTTDRQRVESFLSQKYAIALA